MHEASATLIPLRIVLAAGLDHRDGVLARFGEPVGEHAACGARAHDHIVELFPF
jgi:hypothetical protein